MMLSEAIREWRRDVVAEAAADPGWLTPRKIECVVAVLDAWSAEAANMEFRLAVFGPHAPIVEVDVATIIGVPR